MPISPPDGLVFAITGGRRFTDERFVWDHLTDLMVSSGPLGAMVNGMAKSGVDLFAYRWAQHVGLSVREFPADWEANGEAAGPIRNQQMLDENPDIGLLVVFPGHSGTVDMTRRARKLGIQRLFHNQPEDDNPVNQLAKWG